MESSKKTMAAPASLFSVVLCTCVFVCHWASVAGSEADSHNGNHSSRYPLVSFDFGRIEIPFVICLWILIASLAKIGFHLHHKLPSVVPESCLLIILGLIVGSILHYSHVASTSEYVLDSHVFFIYLLPPIIFDAGYFMPIRSFFDNIGSVLLLAIVNTLFNTALIGFSLFAVSAWGLIGREISMLNCLIFSALISAVDPVAVIATFEEIHVNQMLYIIVFGESLLNDGVTVVLYHMMEGFLEIGESNIIPMDIVTGFGSFFIIALGGSLIGILYGFFGGFITKYTEKVKTIEPLFIFVLGYLMYLTSEMMHLSGILALSFGGIVLRHYVEHNVSKKTATTIRYMMKLLSNIAETIIFMFLGLSTVVDTLDWNLAFIFFALLFCLVYRVLGVTILSMLLNRRRLVKLTKIDQFIMAYGGLRGGIAFCLALSLNEELVPEKPLFVTATIIIVFFTVFVQGISIGPVVNALKVKRQPMEDPSLNQKIHETMIDHLMAGMEDLTSRSSHNLMRTKFRRFNHKYLRPFFNREKPQIKATKIMNTYHNLNEQDALKSVNSVAKLTPVSSSHPDLHIEDQNQVLIKGGVVNQGYERTPADGKFDKALKTGRHRVQWNPHRLLEEESESSDGARVMYRRQSGHPANVRRSQPLNGSAIHRTVAKSDSSDSTDAVTINFTHRKSLDDIQPEQVEHEETSAEKELPWKQTAGDLNPPITSNNVVSGDEPVIANVPSWVNNLSYSHITETGSPYISPDVTYLPEHKETHKPVYSIFPSTKEVLEHSLSFPNPWTCNGDAVEDTPQPMVSPMVTETSERSHDFLQSSHTDRAQAHHVIKSATSHILQELEGPRKKAPQTQTLSDVASAPDLVHHWQPIKKAMFLHSEAVLTELALQEGVKNRIQEWLSKTNSTPGLGENTLGGDIEEETEEEECDPELKQRLEEELDLDRERRTNNRKH